ncbi:MAG: molybdenum cofactor guanylyltransferase, partial [Chloroflexi bacterium]|nr:molybdenum cofactor guanylyltransferase [Chloroflexota bacterium]
MDDSIGVSAIVLAGGLSRRLGRDKALEPFGGAPLISRVIGRLATLTDETVVVVNSKARAAELPLPAGAKTAVDIYPDSGSLGGIFTGLTTASNEWGFVVACDMPFLNTALIKHIL